MLASYSDPDDPRVAALGALGVGENADKDLERLTHLGAALVAPVASGEIAVVAELAPAKLAEHAAHQTALSKDKAGSVAVRQVETTDLAKARKTTAKVLQRVKNFVKSSLGEDHLEAFGYGIPAPSTRPRLVVGEGEKAPVPPVAEPKPEK